MNQAALQQVRDFNPFYSPAAYAPPVQRSASPVRAASPKKVKPSPFTGNETLEEAQAICKSKKKVFRKGYTKQGGAIIGPACVKKSPSNKSAKKSSPKKSAKKSSPKKSGKKSCPSGKVYRKSYKSASGKRVAAKCVKKGGPKKSTRKSTKKSSPRKSCPTGKVYRKGYKSPGKKRVAGKCVKKGGPKKSTRKSTRKSSTKPVM